MTNTCGVQSTVVVTMAMQVLHNSCNTYAHDLSDICMLLGL